MHRRSLASALAAALLLCPPAVASAAAPPASVTLSGTLRDFRGSDLPARGILPPGHVDFESASGAETGIVTSRLGDDGLPVYAKGTTGSGSATTHGRAAFDQWFRDTPDVNLAEPLTLTLNRLPDDSYRYDNQTFFPLDGRGWVARGAELTRGNPPHNFSFTAELHSELLYTGSEVVTVTGDDDIFIYVNGRLALDLGGVHGPLSGSITLSQRAAQLELTPGSLVDLDIFVAERHSTGSTFRLTTPRLGFEAGSATVAAGASPAVGDVLTCDTAGWPADAALTYVWMRDGAAIDGATDPTYATTDEDGDRMIACRVTGARRTAATTTSAAVTVTAPVVDPVDDDPPVDRPPTDDPPVDTPPTDPGPGPVVVPDPPIAPLLLPAPVAPPVTVTVTEQPNALTRSREVRIAFAADPSAAGYECQLDGGRWQACTSPYVLRALRAGDHRVAIRAVMPDGRRGAASTHAFQVNPYAPRVALGSGALRAARGGIVPLRITCSAREGEGRGSCRGSLQLRRTAHGRGRARVQTLGRATFSAGAGRTVTVRVRLTAAARRSLTAAPGHRAAVRVVLDVRDLAGNRGQLSFARTLRG